MVLDSFNNVTHAPCPTKLTVGLQRGSISQVTVSDFVNDGCGFERKPLFKVADTAVMIKSMNTVTAKS